MLLAVLALAENCLLVLPTECHLMCVLMLSAVLSLITLLQEARARNTHQHVLSAWHAYTELQKRWILSACALETRLFHRFGIKRQRNLRVRLLVWAQVTVLFCLQVTLSLAY